jgi:hypothetical protein
MTFVPLRRWTTRALNALVLLGALSRSDAVVHGQSAAAPAAPAAPTIRKEYTKDAKFKLPIRIDPSAGDKVREVILYVKNSPNAPWLRHESVPPTVSAFTYESKEDGEFYFQLVTVDQSGKPSPADINKVPPGLHVIVDTKPPTLEGQYGHVDGEPCIRCVMTDDHADQQSVKAYAVTPTGERLLPPMPRQANVFRLSSSEINGNVRIEGTDLAGNKSTKLLPSLKSLQGGGPAVASGLAPGLAPAAPEASAPLPLPTPTPIVKDNTSVPPVIPDSAPTPPPALAQNSPLAAPPLPGNLSSPNPPASPAIVAPPSIVTPPPGIAPSIPAALPADNGTTQVSTFPAENANINAHYRAESPPPRMVGNRRLLTSRRASIEYRLDSVGSSGVGKVEIFVTPDNGQTWTSLGEDHDKKSPADIDLPGEGVYGVRLVITNNHGFGGKTPTRGDQPHVTIEVDTTAPSVQVRPIEIVPQQASIDIRWTALDTRQLAEDPISIYYRARPDSNWIPIARNLKNEGQYRWNVPRDVPGQFTLKVEAADLAGNVGRAESPPITLDVQVPNVEVVGVTGGRN